MPTVHMAMTPRTAPATPSPAYAGSTPAAVPRCADLTSCGRSTASETTSAPTTRSTEPSANTAHCTATSATVDCRHDAPVVRPVSVRFTARHSPSPPVWGCSLATPTRDPTPQLAAEPGRKLGRWSHGRPGCDAVCACTAMPSPPVGPLSYTTGTFSRSGPSSAVRFRARGCSVASGPTRRSAAAQIRRCKSGRSPSTGHTL
jgi:hypothetical protein